MPRPFTTALRTTVLCSILCLSGCEKGSEYEVFEVLPSQEGDYYELNGHWDGRAGSGYEFSMDLNNSSEGRTRVTGEMHRRGMTGSLDGSLSAGGHESALMSFWVKWPDGAKTSGRVAIENHEKMINGSLDDGNTSDTFTAERR